MRTNKRGVVMSLPVTPRLAAILEKMPAGQLLSLTSPRGKPWDPTHRSKSIKEAARAAGIDERIRLYDARGTACTRLLLAGATPGEIALCMGWSVRHAAAMIETCAALEPTMTDSVLIRLEQARTGTVL